MTFLRRSSLLLLPVVLMLAGCAGSDPTSVPTEVPSPSGSSSQPNLDGAPGAVERGADGIPRGADALVVDDQDPTSVAVKAVVTAWTWDSAIDRAPQDAARRAAPWMTPEAGALAANARTNAASDQWLQVSGEQGWTSATATVIPEDEAPDTAEAAGRLFHLVVTPRDRAGTVLPSWSLTVAVSVLRSADGSWRVGQMVAQPWSAP